jgi:hypothetical protein
LDRLINTHQAVGDRELGVQAKVDKLRGGHGSYFTR